MLPALLPARFLACALLTAPAAFADRSDRLWNEGWSFAKDVAEPKADTRWAPATLPHTASLEPLFIGRKMWMGDCVYRKTITPEPSWKGRCVFLDFEGAMHTASVKLDGREIAKHYGGYLPFRVDLTEALRDGRPHELTVHLDNRENPEVPPGRPLARLDFSWYGGLYRNVHLVVQDPLRITDPVAENLPASGGLLVTFRDVSAQSAVVNVRAHVRNGHADSRPVKVRCTLADGAGAPVVAETPLTLGPGEAGVATAELRVPSPKLWSPRSPHLYRLVTEVISGAETADRLETACGIRSARCSASEGFVLNGEKLYLRGTNRHMDYPYVGYALPDAAQWRDAYKIKRAGFDLVRLSHYPNPTAFLDACDHYGIIVMEPIPGWQFFKPGLFAERSLQTARDMIRRDRNHPACLFWETSLNETGMPAPFLKELHDIAKAEGPGAFSASHTGKFHDVFIPARQHTGGPLFWDKWKDRDRAIFTAEYGDYEYLTGNLASNFDQDNPAVKLRKEEVTSRQRRSDGEARMLRQARNFQEAHNQNHRNPAMVGDANWLFNDYNRGLFEAHCTSGITDIFRLPKFVNHFYASQRDAAGEAGAAPVVFIASFWNAKSSPRLRVYSNGDSVELFVNGRSLGRAKPDADVISDRIPHPPFSFDAGRFEPGELRAVAYLKGVRIGEHVVRTPGAPARIRLVPDLAGHPLEPHGKDLVFVYAEITDERGVVVPDAAPAVSFRVAGAGLASPESVTAEAGVATALVETGGAPATLEASSPGLASATLTLRP